MLCIHFFPRPFSYSRSTTNKSASRHSSSVRCCYDAQYTETSPHLFHHYVSELQSTSTAPKGAKLLSRKRFGKNMLSSLISGRWSIVSFSVCDNSSNTEPFQPFPGDFMGGIGDDERLRYSEGRSICSELIMSERVVYEMHQMCDPAQSLISACKMLKTVLFRPTIVEVIGSLPSVNLRDPHSLEALHGVARSWHRSRSFQSRHLMWLSQTVVSILIITISFSSL